MIIILMGVAGSGKTAVGQALARALGFDFVEGDELHSAENRTKMSAGIALDDQDRMPWLAAIAMRIRDYLDQKRGLVVSCSALKAAYRKQLLLSPKVRLVYLKGDPTLIARRLKQRKKHFFNAQLLQSQFDTLEEPEEALTVHIDQPVAAIVATIRAELVRTQG
ncbi:MAG: gluconokinase [Chlamydiota bacterium]